MSDFGASVSVFRTDGRSVGPDDERRVREAAQSLQFTDRDRIGPYDHFDLRFGGSRADGVEGVGVFLSGYFIGDDEGNDGLDPDVIIAREEVVADQFAADLSRLLGEDYELVPYSGYH